MVSPPWPAVSVKCYYSPDVRQPGPETTAQLEPSLLRFNLPSLVVRAGRTAGSRTIPGICFRCRPDLPTERHNRGPNHISPSATSVPGFCPAGTTPGSSSVPGTLDSAIHPRSNGLFTALSGVWVLGTKAGWAADFTGVSGGRYPQQFCSFAVVPPGTIRAWFHL